MPPRVSIVTRTKDRPQFLARALRSIAAQSFDDWELVVVNDGGDPAVLARTIADSPLDADRVRVLSHPSPTGRWPAANAGVRASTGEFLVLHDDDDSWAPEFLARAVEYLDRNPDRLGVVSRIQIVWERTTGGGFETTGTEPFLPDSLAPLLSDQLSFNRFVPIALLYRRDVHETLGAYDEAVPVVGDWLFNTKLLMQGPLEYLGPTPLAYWHQRPGATGTDGNSVIAEARSHELQDALIRDAALRSALRHDGDGMALYLTRLIDRRAAEVESVVRAEISRLRDETSNPFVIATRRAWRRLRRRIRPPG